LPQFVVLYGGAIEAGALNKDSTARCTTALRVAHRLPDAIIVFSADESIPDLRHVTLAYLRNWGWPTERLITPATAHNTFGETKTAFSVLREHRTNSVIVVSSWYHMWRIRAMWRYLGFRGEIVCHASKETLDPVGSLLWEVKGFIKFFWYVLLRKI